MDTSTHHQANSGIIYQDSEAIKTSKKINNNSGRTEAINGSHHHHNNSSNTKVSSKTPLPVGVNPKYGSCEVRDESLRSVCCVGDSSRQQPEKPKGAEGDGPKSWLEQMAGRIPCLGIILSLCASLFLGSAGMLVKMTQSVHGVQVAVFRAVIQLLVYGFVIKLRGLPWIPKEGERMPVLGRAILGAASITCSYFALKLIPLGDATVIRFSLPIWTLIVSYLVLNESCSLVKVAAVVVSISGVVLIAKPEMCIYVCHTIWHTMGLESDDQFAQHATEYQSVVIQALPTGPYVQEPSHQLEGSLLALSSSVCLAMSLIALRLCNKTPAEITIVWLSIFSILIGTITLISMGEWRLPNNWLDVIYILLNGLCGSIGQWFITSALKIEQSGVISLARTFDIEVAFLYSAFLLKEQIRVTSLVGSLLVSCGVVAVVVPKWLGSRGGSGNSAAASTKDLTASSEEGKSNTQQQQRQANQRC